MIRFIFYILFILIASFAFSRLLIVLFWLFKFRKTYSLKEYFAKIKNRGKKDV